MIDIGTPGDINNHRYADVVNDSGQIAGVYIEVDDYFYKGYTYEDGTMTSIGTPGDSEFFVEDMNDLGQIVGYAMESDKAYMYDSGSWNYIGTLGGNWSTALGINNLGQIVGYSVTENNEHHAFLYDDGEMIDLGSLSGGVRSSASAINDRGQIIGSYTDTSGVSHSVLWSPVTAPEPVSSTLFIVGAATLGFRRMKKRG
jgi:probable HAF family extracellular repeat protein